jgi:PAS domain S-box-containing protein
MGALTRAKDWSETPLGPAETWPESSKIAVSICLNSRFPICLWLGPDLRLLYNDPYISLLGEKHPAVLGVPGREVWKEIWPTIGPMHAQVQAGSPTWVEDFQLFISRDLPREEGYFTFGYSPILAKDGLTVEGTFCAVTETTKKIIGERRLATLRDLGNQSTPQRTAEAACRAAAVAMRANPLDIPFAAIYLLDEKGATAHRAAGVRLPENAAAFPEQHRFVNGAEAAKGPWPLGEVAATQRAQEVKALPGSVGAFPCEPWPDLVETAFVLPLPAPSRARPAGFLIVGLSPRRVLDADYRSFLDLVAGHIAAAIAQARAFEAELASITRLHELSTRLTAQSDLSSLLHEVLDTAMELQHADFGNIQLYNEENSSLEIVAQRGFQKEFLDYFRSVDASKGSACGLALRNRARVIIEDIDLDPDFAPHLGIAASSGFRAVQSTPLFDRRSGEPVGMLSTHFRKPHRPSERELRMTDLYASQAADVIALRLSEQRLRESEARHQFAVDLVGLARYSWDPRTNALEWDGRLRAMWGLSQGAHVGYDVFLAGVHPEDRSRVEAAIAQCIDPNGNGMYDIEYRVIGIETGVERWIATRGRTSFDKGRPVGFVGVALDVTERKRAEQANLLLISELLHRTRNLLAVVDSLATETMASCGSFEDFAPAFRSRLSALSRVQSLLSRHQSSAATMGELVHLELRAFATEPNARRIRVAGPEVPLSTRAVQILALALHELATNARKYGALGTSNGCLSVTWTVTGDGRNRRLALEWHETELASLEPNAGPVRMGFGRRLIEETLPFQLDAETRLEFGKDDVRCSIALTLEPPAKGARDGR